MAKWKRHDPPDDVAKLLAKADRADELADQAEEREARHRREGITTGDGSYVEFRRDMARRYRAQAEAGLVACPHPYDLAHNCDGREVL